jgi:hypothetical protein
MDRADADTPPTVWVTVAEAAEKSGIGTSTIRQWYRSGRIPTQRAEGDRGAFLVPLDAVVALADKADEEGDDLGAAVIDLNASYWSAQTEAAREEAAAAQRELASVRAELEELRSRSTSADASATAAADASSDDLAAARAEVRQLQEDLEGAEADLDQIEAELAAARKERDDAVAQLEALRADAGDRGRLETDNHQLRDELDTTKAALAAARAEAASAAEELETHRARIGLLQEELTTLRAVTAKAGSITDNSWLEQPTNSYRSPIRPQGMAAADALSGLLASTTPDVRSAPRRAEDELDDEAEQSEATPAPAKRVPKPAKTMFDDVDRRKAAASAPTVSFPPASTERVVEDDPATADEDGAAPVAAEVDDETWAEQRRTAARDFGFGQHDDDLLPVPEKKTRRGRK